VRGPELCAMALAGLLLASAGQAVAQVRGEPKQVGRFRLGPVRVTPRIELRNAGVDTNVFNTASAPVPDTSVVLRTTLEGYLPVRGRLRLWGTGYTDFNYFRRESTERSTDFGGSGHAELPLGPLVLFGGGAGQQARQRATIDLDERVLRHERSGYAGAEMRVGSRVTLLGQGQSQVSRYGRTFVNTGDPFRLARGLDRNTLTATGEMRLRLTTLTTGVLRAEAISDRFLQQRDPGRITHSYRYLGGFQFDPLAAVNGSVLVGFREIPASSAGSLPPYRGAVFQAGTAIPLFGLARLSIDGQRDVVFAATVSESRAGRLRNSYVSTRLAGHLELGLPFDLLGRAGAGLEEARYLLPYPRGGALFRRGDHLYTVDASLLRLVGGALRVGGTVAFSRRVSNAPGSSYQGWRYGLQAELRP
jgi:hypothetical protein